MEKISIFGINIDNITFYDATELVKEYLNGNTLKAICTPNTEIVMAARDDAYLKNLINGFDLIIPDGIGLIYGSRIRKKPLKE
ncbi:MAG TPA: glycosyltransferase, partial [Tissierellia bacterium]|nr:glycosyltransferase [Tissierellia bacterium]